MEPITREEALMNGDYIEPITREEMILAGEDIEPITRREWFLKKYRGGGDVEVVTLHANENTTYVAPEGQAYSPVVVDVPVPTLTTLEVDENGTYTAPSGTAYNEVEVALPLDDKTITQNGTYLASDDNLEGYDEVIVNVPLPENAYLLKDIENTPTAIATFSDGANLPMPKLEVGIEPVQDLHGYDAPWVGGAGKNKLNNIASSKTENNVTFTVNSDGSVKVYSTGATANTTLVLTNNDNPLNIKANTEYILSGCPSNGSSSKYEIMLVVSPTGGGSITNDYGDGVLIPSSESDRTLGVQIVVRNGQAIDSTFYPMVRLASVSDATFAPYSNICPISGWDEVNVSVSGVNVWDEEWEVGGYSGSDGSVWNTTDRIRSKSTNYIHIKPNTTYFNTCDYSLYVFYYDKNKNYINYVTVSNRTTFVTPTNAYYIRFFVNATYDTTYNHDISINYPSTDTSYHAYNGHTTTIQFKDGDNPLTVYGGTLDVVSGVMTVDRAEVDMGTLTWNYSDGVFTASVSGIKSGTYTDTNLISSIYPIKPMSYSSFDYGMRYNSSTSIGVKNSAYTDATAFKTAMDGVQLVYELATPLTIQLTPTVVKSLQGINNVWADTGDVIDGEYFGKEV